MKGSGKYSQFAMAMHICAAAAGFLTLCFTVLQFIFSKGWLLSCAITFGTCFYHFIMRLFIGAVVPNTFDPRSRWFQPRPWETALYKKLRLKRWKDRVPTYDPTAFSLQHHTLAQILGNMCQAEVVHELIVLGSFLPLSFALVFGSFGVFAITSVLAAAVDCLFILLQRYNRPRLMRLLEKQSRRPNPINNPPEE